MVAFKAPVFVVLLISQTKTLSVKKGSTIFQNSLFSVLYFTLEIIMKLFFGMS